MFGCNLKIYSCKVQTSMGFFANLCNEYGTTRQYFLGACIDGQTIFLSNPVGANITLYSLRNDFIIFHQNLNPRPILESTSS